MQRGSLVGLVAFAVGATGLAIGGPAAPVGAMATVPTGFVDESVADVPDPTAVEALPDGRVVILDQNGHVRIFTPGSGLNPTPALSLRVCGGGGTEMGLLGFAAGENFIGGPGGGGEVYVYYTAPVAGGCVNRVSAFAMRGPTIDAASERVILDNLPGTVTDPAGNHNGGDVEIGHDGYLYVAIGDSGRDPRGNSGGAGDNDAARDLSILSGKIARVATDGGIPPDNPYQGAGTVSCARSGISAPPTARCQEIFASGLRNPYRFAFDPNDGATRFFINDVGQGTREEVNEGRLGADYGWNTREGACPRGATPPCGAPPAGLIDPLTDYGRSGGCTYITGGAFVPNGVWPAAYDGAYLFADGGCGRMFVRTADGNVNYATPFASGLGQIADMAFVPDATGYSLYYSQNGQNAVRRIRYTGATAPTPVTGLRLQAIPPTRVYDTRNAIGTTAGKVRAGLSRVVDVRAPGGTGAVLVNVTMISAATGFLQAWPPRTVRPATSMLNTTGGAPGGFDAAANSAIVPVVDGKLMFSSSVTADVLVDVLGYFTAQPGNGGEFRALAPSRLVDQRQPGGTRLASGSMNPYTSVDDHDEITVAGQLGVPATGAGAVAVIVTAVTGSVPRSCLGGYATIWPSREPRPDASNVNTVGGGDIRANLAIVPIGVDGKISVYRFCVEDVLIDVVGWFTAGSVASTGTGRLTVTGSQRIADSRQSPPLGFGRVATGGSGVLALTPTIPAQATAVVHNLTSSGPDAWGFVTAHPATGARPEASNLNVTGPGQTRAALAITSRPAAIPGGPLVLPAPPPAMTYFSSTSMDLIVDVYGWFV